MLRVASCQILVGLDKAANLAAARVAVADAAKRGARIVVLPECFNSPYDTKQFAAYAENIPERASDIDPAAHASTAALCEMAREHGIVLVGGSIPERDGPSIFNTCMIIGPDGNFIGKHRKVHLFDIDVPGGIRFQESETLSAGSNVTVVSTPWCKLGVGICYDLRFPLLSRAMRDAGADVLVFPGAFNMTTGPVHWDLLQRARALDNQLFVVTASPARNPDSSYTAWGHSSIVSPWGELIGTSDHAPSIVTADIDLSRIKQVRYARGTRRSPQGGRTSHCAIERSRRLAIPTSTQQRPDVYSSLPSSGLGEEAST